MGGLLSKLRGCLCCHSNHDCLDTSRELAHWSLNSCAGHRFPHLPPASIKLDPLSCSVSLICCKPHNFQHVHKKMVIYGSYQQGSPLNREHARLQLYKKSFTFIIPLTCTLVSNMYLRMQQTPVLPLHLWQGVPMFTHMVPAGIQHKKIILNLWRGGQQQKMTSHPPHPFSFFF